MVAQGAPIYLIKGERIGKNIVNAEGYHSTEGVKLITVEKQ